MDDELMTVEQAGATYDVSPLTLRRRAQYGEIDGAVKVRARRGQEWRIPKAATDARGYARRTESESDVAGLSTSLRKLTETLAEAQRENIRLNREPAVAEAARARLSPLLDAEHPLAVDHGAPSVVDLRDEDRTSTSG